MLFLRLIMGRRYLLTHLAECAICISGIILNTTSNLCWEDGGGIQHLIKHVKGGVFAMIGMVLLGLDNVLSEIIVNDYGSMNKMLLMKGLFRMLILVVQLAVLERDDVRTLFREGGRYKLSWRMALFLSHLCTMAISVAGEMQFLYISVA